MHNEGSDNKHVLQAAGIWIEYQQTTITISYTAVQENVVFFIFNTFIFEYKKCWASNKYGKICKHTGNKKKSDLL